MPPAASSALPNGNAAIALKPDDGLTWSISRYVTNAGWLVNGRDLAYTSDGGKHWNTASLHLPAGVNSSIAAPFIAAK